LWEGTATGAARAARFDSALNAGATTTAGEVVATGALGGGTAAAASDDDPVVAGVADVRCPAAADARTVTAMTAIESEGGGGDTCGHGEGIAARGYVDAYPSSPSDAVGATGGSRSGG